MLNPRIVPVLLIKNKGLVKTVGFKTPKYVGDPINAVKIFNEQQADELTVLDIDASVEGREPDYKLIEHLAVECRMPLCYGGGIKTVEQAKRILGLGVEKISISSAAVAMPSILEPIAEQIGRQSVVVTLDVKRALFGNKYQVVVNNATKNTKISPFEFVRQAEKYGAGEIVINSVDNDGLMKGYDLGLIHRIHQEISVPLTALGGAGSLQDIAKLIENEKIIGAAAGSLFVFKGKYKAVLINYPSDKDKQSLFIN